MCLLNPRDRETISGDLLEEYREEKLRALGRARANYWYLRQLISFASVQVLGGSLLKQLLIFTCFFTVAAGLWLCVMENILKHDGYGGRSVIALGIALQSLGTLLLIALSGGAVFRNVVTTGAVGIVLLGGWAILGIMRAQHFEGFVLVIGVALIMQGGLTIATLLPARQAHSG